MSEGEWKMWKMEDVKEGHVVRGLVTIPNVPRTMYTPILVVDGLSYGIPLTGLDWVDGDELVVTRVIDGEGDLYLRFVRKKPV